MTERILLVIGIVLLASGLGVWGIVADRDRPTATRTAIPVATDLRAASHEGGPAELRALLERATMGHVPLIRLFDRDSTAIYGIALPGRDAVDIADRLRQVENPTHVPVVLGGEWDVRAHEDSTRATMDPPSAIVARARRFDLDAWITRRLESVASELRVESASSDPWAPRAEGRERFRLVRDPTLDSPRTSVVIALLPTHSSPDTPAWLAFGNWRGCPEPSVHVAMLTRWHERYGAEVIGIGGDTIELRVARPPLGREQALALAREHVAYAPFLLAGGTRSLADIAASIVGARVWSFRFDLNSVSHR